MLRVCKRWHSQHGRELGPGPNDGLQLALSTRMWIKTYIDILTPDMKPTGTQDSNTINTIGHRFLTSSVYYLLLHSEARHYMCAKAWPLAPFPSWACWCDGNDGLMRTFVIPTFTRTKIVCAGFLPSAGAGNGPALCPSWGRARPRVCGSFPKFITLQSQSTHQAN